MKMRNMFTSWWCLCIVWGILFCGSLALIIFGDEDKRIVYIPAIAFIGIIEWFNISALLYHKKVDRWMKALLKEQEQ